MGYVVALVLTLAIEIPVVVAIGARLPASHASPSSRRLASVALAVNVGTHVAAFAVAWPLLDGRTDRTIALVCLELAIVAIECAAFARWAGLAWWPALVLSAGANVASVVGGWLIAEMVSAGWPPTWS